MAVTYARPGPSAPRNASTLSPRNTSPRLQTAWNIRGANPAALAAIVEIAPRKHLVPQFHPSSRHRSPHRGYLAGTSIIASHASQCAPADCRCPPFLHLFSELSRANFRARPGTLITSPSDALIAAPSQSRPYAYAAGCPSLTKAS